MSQSINSKLLCAITINWLLCSQRHQLGQNRRREKRRKRKEENTKNERGKENKRWMRMNWKTWLKMQDWWKSSRRERLVTRDLAKCYIHLCFVFCSGFLGEHYISGKNIEASLTINIGTLLSNRFLCCIYWSKPLPNWIPFGLGTKVSDVLIFKFYGEIFDTLVKHLPPTTSR